MAKTLPEIVAASPAFAEELARLCTGGTRTAPIVLNRVCPAAYAFVAAMAAAAAPSPCRVWVVADALPTQERLAAELPLWTEAPIIFLPEQELHINNGLSDPDLAAERLDALHSLCEPPSTTQVVIVTPVALRCPAPLFRPQAEGMLHVAVGQELSPESLQGRLQAAEFERTEQVIARGQWSLRGGIIDIFPLQTAWPLRIEFFGDEVESIRAFDVDSQLSFRKLPAADLVLEEPPAESTPEEWIADGDRIVALPDCGYAGDVQIFELPPDREELLPEEGAESEAARAFIGTPLGEFDTGDFVMQEARRALARNSLQQWRRDRWRVVMYFPHEGEKARFEEICGDDEAWQGVQSRDGDLPRGFTVPGAKLAVLSAAEIFGRYTSVSSRRRDDREDRMRRERAQAPLREIAPGDLVIHAAHGLGKFVGIVRDAESGEEELNIQYAGGVLLRLPLQQSYLVSKYVGLGAKAPELSRLGDARWKRACKAAEQAIADYAGQLLEVQAERECGGGSPHPPDSAWMWQFESAFPFRETPDQARAISQTKADMESTRPMDRLICGDVGFGKTEVAIRAAFKCVTGGRQVAVLAPTTVLADQHWRTFRARMSEYPIRVELLSRFTPPKKAREVLEGLRTGAVDIVIGTHRLISADVSFDKLGLVVIDEEQRFGVRHKEQFKRRFRMVDMLTLSATPIPRTLYVALMGARDMSTIDTPPLNRLPVQTAVCPYNEELITKAIERELDRKGQVFFLHNRVQSIHKVAEDLHRLVPRARIVIGHGQMDKTELELIMRDFIAGKADVLLCTSIIESGIDIPNANTIIIDRADRFGLADLYQLRGRVGRGVHRAYAYLLLPRQALCTADARKRVSAIKQFTELGSGFKIAMRDLEIRGAGNLLGTRQSGHIAAIGFELYCQLLRQCIEHLQGKVPTTRAEAAVKADFLCFSEASLATRGADQTAHLLGAFLPAAYMESPRARMAAYAELAKTTSTDEVDELALRWKDRFGPLPRPANTLLSVHKIKILASRRRIASVEFLGQKLLLTRNGNYITFNNHFPRLSATKPTDKLKETIRLLETI
ncbi:MAG: transcription-repair coupling factor [Akkermansia muciniphila]|nr:transcription-repair coupling factor [Akkermansia muciniphila]